MIKVGSSSCELAVLDRSRSRYKVIMSQFSRCYRNLDGFFVCYNFFWSSFSTIKVLIYPITAIPSKFSSVFCKLKWKKIISSINPTCQCPSLLSSLFFSLASFPSSLPVGESGAISAGSGWAPPPAAARRLEQAPLPAAAVLGSGQGPPSAATWDPNKK